MDVPRAQELLAQAAKAVADLADSRRRLDWRLGRLRDKADGLQEQARRHFGAGREDLAREDLIRRSAVLAEMDELRKRQAEVQTEQDSLTAGLRRLQETALAGITEEMAEVGRILRRAKAAAAQVDARIRARADKDSSGVAESGSEFGAGSGPLGDADSLQEEIDAVSMRREVEEELARLKRMRTNGGRSPRNGS